MNYNFKNIDELLKEAALEEDMLMGFIHPMKDVLINNVINPVLNGEIDETSLPIITFITSTGYSNLINQIINDFNIIIDSFAGILFYFRILTCIVNNHRLF